MRQNQINQHKQGNASNKDESGNRQDTGNMCIHPEKTGRAPRQKQARKTPMNSYWGGGGIMRDRWNKSGPGRTGSTQGQEVKSLGPEQRWAFNNNNNSKPLWMRDMTRGQTRPRDRRQIWHHAGSAQLLTSNTRTHSLETTALYFHPHWKKTFFPSPLSSFFVWLPFLFWSLIYHILPCKNLRLCLEAQLNK